MQFAKLSVMGIFLFIGACASTTGISSTGNLVDQIQRYDGGDIVTGDVRSAKIESLDGCLYVEDRNRRYVAFFPTDTIALEKADTLVLSDSDRIRIGKNYNFILEFYPKLTNRNVQCNGENVYVRSIVNDGG